MRDFTYKFGAIAALTTLAGTASLAHAQPAPATASFAAERGLVTLSYDGSVSFPQAVWVVGSTPELGAWDVTKAVKMVPTGGASWGIDIALPAGQSFEYKFISRSILAGSGDDPVNASDLSGVQSMQVPGEAAFDVRSVWARLEMTEPSVHWIDANGQAGSVRLRAAVLNDDVSNPVFFAPSAGTVAEGAVFWIEDGASDARIPAEGAFNSTLKRVFVQDGDLYSYEPAHHVSAPRRNGFRFQASDTAMDYAFDRQVDVYLPRGYDEHSDRSYPVLYFQDGQVAFSDNPNRAWHAQQASHDLARQGLAREMIIVAIHHGSDRGADYLDPSIMGEGDKYLDFLVNHLKPHVDSTYRTLTGPEHTGSVGASYGGVAAFYHGWQRPDVFGLVGAFSPSFWATAIETGVQYGGARDIKVYLDSGDAGNSNDGYENTLVTRDRLLLRNEVPNTYGDAIYHVVGHGDLHHERYWAQRLPNAMRYLLPAYEQTGPLPDVCDADFAEPWNVVNLQDLFVYIGAYLDGSAEAQLAYPFGSTPDINDLFAYIAAYTEGCGE
ncbi:MAG: alpha/beta hydrolase-fold protein [Planctomycetota bacterium]